jgi:N-methylhydantoinase A/oxoprolinase/acetone carboxylase beta subunit
MSYRLGVDVGGTFTDVLLVDECAGPTWRAKTSSTPQPVRPDDHLLAALTCAPSAAPW